MFITTNGEIPLRRIVYQSKISAEIPITYFQSPENNIESI